MMEESRGEEAQDEIVTRSPMIRTNKVKVATKMGIIPFVRDAIASATRERLALCTAILISTTPVLGVAVPQSGLSKLI
jgi:hypothetical protein